MGNVIKSAQRNIYLYLLLVIVSILSCYMAIRHEVIPRTPEQSLLAIKEAYKMGNYEEVEGLVAFHRSVFKQSFHDNIASIEKSMAREKEAKCLFADIQRAINLQQSIEAYTKIEAYLKLFPNCSNGDEVRTMASQYKIVNEQELTKAVLGRLAVSHARVSPSYAMIVDSNASNRRLILAVYIPNPTKDEVMNAVVQLRIEMPAWEHEIIFLRDPDFSIINRHENEDKIIATYLSVSRTLSLINLNDEHSEVINNFP